MSKEIEDARQTVQRVEVKLSEAKQRLAQIASEVGEVALPATLGDQKAAKRLEALKQEELTLRADIGHLEAAIGSAHRLVAMAERDALDDQERVKAERALEAAAAFRERGEKVVAALEELVSQLMGFERDYRELQLLDYPPTSTWVLTQANLTLAIHTRLQGFGLHIRPLQHHEKKDLLELVSAWESNIKARAKARLSRNKPAKRAA